MTALGKLQVPACLRGRAQRLRRRARGRSCDFGMAVFADLDLRAGSDPKALRGLVENAAHRESPWLRGPPCLPSLAAPPTVGPRLGGTWRGWDSVGSLGRPWK